MQGLLHRRGWILLSLAALFVGLVAFLLLAHNVARALPDRIDAYDCLYREGSGTWLGHCPERMPLSGSSFRTGVMVGSIPDLYSIEGVLAFDPQYLEIVQTRIPRRDPTNDPCAVVPALTTTPDNDAGTLRFSAVFDPPLTDGCTVFLIDWRIKEISATGVTTPTFSSRKMIDSQGKVIPHHTKPKDEPIDSGCVVSGQVLLQGHTDPSGQRPDHSGTDIMLSTLEECPSNWTFSSLWDWPGILSTKTDSLGNFYLDSKSQPCRCLFAFKHAYLTAQGKPPMEGRVDKAPITLLGGDVTQDDAINVFDLALIASRYDSIGDPVCDVNGDNKCDVYDLAITAGNSGKPRGPQTWP